jgi:hypothetical protein
MQNQFNKSIELLEGRLEGCARKGFFFQFSGKKGRVNSFKEEIYITVH